jgi:hypothetical protein
LLIFIYIYFQVNQIFYYIVFIYVSETGFFIYFLKTIKQQLKRNEKITIEKAYKKLFSFYSIHFVFNYAYEIYKYRVEASEAR